MVSVFTEAVDFVSLVWQEVINIAANNKKDKFFILFVLYERLIKYTKYLKIKYLNKLINNKKGKCLAFPFFIIWRYLLDKTIHHFI